jgi:hypothetical protein
MNIVYRTRVRLGLSRIDTGPPGARLLHIETRGIAACLFDGLLPLYGVQDLV